MERVTISAQRIQRLGCVRETEGKRKREREKQRETEREIERQRAK
jgi:hypothetical protein